jgi:hypothetical protein
VPSAPCNLQRNGSNSTSKEKNRYSQPFMPQRLDVKEFGVQTHSPNVSFARLQHYLLYLNSDTA